MQPALDRFFVERSKKGGAAPRPLTADMLRDQLLPLLAASVLPHVDTQALPEIQAEVVPYAQPRPETEKVTLEPKTDNPHDASLRPRTLKEMREKHGLVHHMGQEDDGPLLEPADVFS